MLGRLFSSISLLVWALVFLFLLCPEAFGQCANCGSSGMMRSRVVTSNQLITMAPQVVRQRVVVQQAPAVVRETVIEQVPTVVAMPSYNMSMMGMGYNSGMMMSSRAPRQRAFSIGLFNRNRSAGGW